MQQEAGNISCNVTPQKSQRTPREIDGSGRKSVSSQEMKRRLHCTPRNSPDLFSKTPQSNESFRRGRKCESMKRRMQSGLADSADRIPRSYPSGKFVDTLIEQWCKHMGVQPPSSHAGGAQESPTAQETRARHAIEERMVEKLQRKLQAAEETISSLSASRDAELQAKEDILHQLNNDWELITKYYSEISASLKEFQKHKDNLSALYNDVIVGQQSTLKKLQGELNAMKLQDARRSDNVKAIESRAANQEKRIREMEIVEAELRRSLEDARNEAALEKERSHVHAAEKSELIKMQENISSMNQELTVQLRGLQEEKESLSDAFAERNEQIARLQEEMLACRNKMENLLCENAELNARYTLSSNKEKELSKELAMKAQEIERLQANLNARRDIESSLKKDLDTIENKYENMRIHFANVEGKLKEAHTRNASLEKSLEQARVNSERKINELNGKIEVLEKGKERALSEKCLKIRELERAYETLKEKHETEMASLKGEFDVKLAEMRETISTQNSAFVKLNESLKKMNVESKAKKSPLRTKENQDTLVETLKEIRAQGIQSIVTDVDKEIENNPRASHVRELKEQQFNSQQNLDRLKSRSQEKSDLLSTGQDIYNFEAAEANNEMQNILSQTIQDKRIRLNIHSPTQVSDCMENSPYHYRIKSPITSKIETEKLRDNKSKNKNDAMVKRKIFKTRSSGLRQYGTPKKR